MKNMCELRTRLVLFFAIAIAAQNIDAAPIPFDESPSSVAELQKVEIVGTQTDIAKRRDNTSSKVIVSGEDISNQSNGNLLNTLKNFPGISISGSGGKITLQMNGFGAGYIQILLDGNRAPSNFSIDTLATETIDYVEILRSPMAEFSTEATAGTINIHLKKISKIEKRDAKIGTLFGNGFFSPFINFDVSENSGNFSYSSSVNIGHNSFKRASEIIDEGFDSSNRQLSKTNTSSSDVGNYNSVTLTPQASWSSKSGTTASLQAYVNISNSGRSVHEKTDSTQIAPALYPDNTQKISTSNNIYRIILAGSQKIASSQKIEAKMVFDQGQSHRDLGETAATIDPDFEINRFSRNSFRNKGYNVQSKYTNHISDENLFTAGLEFSSTNKYNDLIYNFQKTGMDNTAEDFHSTVRQSSAFAQEEISFGKYFSLYLGLRSSRITISSEGSSFTNSLSATSVFSPLMSSVWRFSEKEMSQIRASFSHTYKTPSPEDLMPRHIFSINNQQNQPDTDGNQNLRTETATGIDIAIERYWLDRSMVSASISYKKLVDYIHNVLKYDNQRWTYYPINDGNAYNKTLILEAKFPLDNFHRSLSGTLMSVNGSKNSSKVKNVPGPYNFIADQLPFSATIGLEHKSEKNLIGLNLSANSGATIQTSKYERSYVTPRRDLDIYGVLNFNSNGKIRISISNLLRKDTKMDSIYSDGNSTLHRSTAYPGAAYFRLSYEAKI